MVLTTRVWQGPKTGSIADLRLVEKVLAAPKPGECRVRVKAVGLNFADVFTALGLYSAAPKGEYTPGLEFSGVVEEVGEGEVESLTVNGYDLGPEGSRAAAAASADLKPGTRVVGVTRFGSYASQLNIPCHLVRPLPAGWTFSQGAGFLVQGLTSLYALRGLGDVRPGSTVLVHSAAGGCGQFATKICQKLGAKVVATVGGASKVDFLTTNFPGYLTPEVVIVRNKSDFGRQLDEALGSLGVSSFDVVLDAVLGDYFRPAYERLGPGGRHVVYGAASMMPSGDRPNWLKLTWQFLKRPKLDLLKMPTENRSVMAFNLIWMFEKYGLLNELLEQLFALDLSPPYIGQSFDFEDAPSALRKFQSGKTVGKVILELDEQQ
ncbi:hypothetical protein BSKO_10529 [Bryopsis sp. KO-2023]|nr:hypothetical protein BSKO_10529 [Bryopsis sp. KO-2023]